MNIHSLRSKTISLVISIALICILTIGAIATRAMNQAAEETSTQFMNELCQDKTHEINRYLDEIQQAVNIVSHYLTEDLQIVELVEGGVIGATGRGGSLGERNWTSERQKELDDYLRQHVQRGRDLFRSIIHSSGSALAYYYRINPEMTLTAPGFLFIQEGSSHYVEHETPDILTYDPGDLAHVGWYYQALNTGRPSWLPVYEDAVTGALVTTYVAPVYKADTFVGVVGMDLSYDLLAEKLQNLDIFQSGYAFLTDDQGVIVYHPHVSIGSTLADLNRGIQEEDQVLTQKGSTTKLLEYMRDDGVPRRAAWRTLDNGLRLFVSAPVTEIEERWQEMNRRIVVFGLLLMAAFIIFATIAISRITSPLRQLAGAAEQILEGNYDAELPRDRKDEVGTLTKSFRQLTAHLKNYISDLNSKAYQDALTRVKNKAAMDILASQLNGLPPEERAYGVAVFDCNELKQINDQHGHSSGDAYLRSASMAICDAFVHCPVFRIGGDEFVTILQGPELEKREELIRDFREQIREVNRKAAQPWERVSLAMGTAVYDAGADTCFEDVMRRADMQMYQDKEKIKAERKGT